MKVHDLKTWPADFEALWTGAKTADIRATLDRTFEVGDGLALREWNPETKLYTGRIIRRRISHITGAPWLWPGLVMLSFAVESAPADFEPAPAEPNPTFR